MGLQFHFPPCLKSMTSLDPKGLIYLTHIVCWSFTFSDHLCNDNCFVFNASEVSQVPIFLYHSAKLMKVLAQKTFSLSQKRPTKHVDLRPITAVQAPVEILSLLTFLEFFFLKTFLQTGFYSTFDTHLIKSKKFKCCGNHISHVLVSKGTFYRIFSSLHHISESSVLPANLRKLHFVACEVSGWLGLTFSTESLRSKIMCSVACQLNIMKKQKSYRRLLYTLWY